MNTTKLTLLATCACALSLATGCQSTGSRFAWMNPARLWHGGSDTAVASTAPELPSSQFESEQETALASAPPAATSAPLATTAPPASAGSVAAAPVDYSVFPATPPSYTSPAPSATEGLADNTVMPQAGPYSAAATAAPPAASTLSPSSPPSVASNTPDSRYGAPVGSTGGSRYDDPPAGSLAGTSSTPTSSYSSPPVSAPPATTTEFDPYSRYSSPPVTNTAAPAMDTLASNAMPSATSIPSAAKVTLPTAPGGYRPGGTSTYPATGSAPTNIATRPSGTESGQMPSAYGVPAYR